MDVLEDNETIFPFFDCPKLEVSSQLHPAQESAKTCAICFVCLNRAWTIPVILLEGLPWFICCLAAHPHPPLRNWKQKNDNHEGFNPAESYWKSKSPFRLVEKSNGASFDMSTWLGKKQKSWKSQKVQFFRSLRIFSRKKQLPSPRILFYAYGNTRPSD